MTQAIVRPLVGAIAKPDIVWERLPTDFILPDDPVESIAQPFVAAALTESLGLDGRITPEMLIVSNMALVARLNQKTTVKAPDWFYVAKASPLVGGLIRRSYTPHTEGEIPAIVMEFLSEEETGEYSMRPVFPYGKMWFYEQILQVPIYLIFDPEDGRLEIRKLATSGKYELQTLDQNNRYWIESLGLYIGLWYGSRMEQTYYWLRWWDISDSLLLWGTEKLEQEHQLLELEQRRAEAEKQRADLAEQEILRLRQLIAESQNK